MGSWIGFWDRKNTAGKKLGEIQIMTVVQLTALYQ